jgi:hypothetical protein
MKRRWERQQDFEAIKQNLFAAGVSTVKAAQAQEEMFTTTLEALTEAYEAVGAHPLVAGQEEEGGADLDADGGAELGAIAAALLVQRQEALAHQDYEAYVVAEEKLQRLDELTVTRLERQVRLLQAQRQLAEWTPPTQSSPPGQEWTEASLKKTYKTLAQVKAAWGLSARSWKEAVQQMNQAAPTS